MPFSVAVHGDVALSLGLAGDAVRALGRGLVALFPRAATEAHRRPRMSRGVCSPALRVTPVHAHAMTLGHVVLGRDADCLERTRAHERVHVRQTERLGALFPFAYLDSSAWALLRGRHYYRDNW